MDFLIHPTYLPSVSHFVVLAKGNTILEVQDNYQKQTFRNRSFIYSPNGKQMLSVPIKHLGTEGHQKFRDVKLEDNFQWKKQHLKSLQTAYRTSPFFEYYEDEITPFFEKKHTFLMDMNLESMALFCECLQLDFDYRETEAYSKEYNPELLGDYRNLVNAKRKSEFGFEPYTQVFSDKHSFIENLSIADLLFNEGPNALTYLESQSI